MEDRKSIKDTTWWAWLELLVMPIVLGGLATWLSFFLNESTEKRERMREYLRDVTAIAADAAADKTAENKNPKLKENSLLRSLARARTLDILRESDGQSKRAIITFLANSDLHYQISLSGADLSSADLSGLYLRDADLSNANLKDTDLTGAKLLGVNFKIKDELIKGATFDNIEYDQCTLWNPSFESKIAESNWELQERDLEEDPCHHKDKKE